jgi:hypothetical protein
MNDGSSARQQIVEKIKGSTNILVTVSSNPSVDELSAALGLTSMLNGMKKHATAVVSGDIPPAITFLEPTKTFENTVDSLRDFIIALDKEKADHLRYKVDGDVVKIFITPYRTVINENDLDFSQGDYNVELVLALGVKDQDNLDKALSAHGKILHDATVATISCGENPSKLGSIDWYEPNASSISEMLVSASEALKTDRALLDEQIATAFLTGIVAATDRFSNNKTSSKVMTMAAQLMAAGANQQLIAAKLEEAHEIGPDKPDDSDEPNSDDDSENSDGTTDMNEGESTKLSQKAAKKKKSAADGELAINHEKEGSLEEVAEQTAVEHQQEAAKTAEEELAEQLSHVAPAAAKPSVSDMQKDLAAASEEVEKEAAEPAPEAVLPPVNPQDSEAQEPSLGGTLNATAEEAQHDNESALESDRNKTILSHNSGKYIGDNKPSFQAPFNAAASESNEPESVDIFDGAPPAPTHPQEPVPQKSSVEPAEPSTDEPTETLEDIDRKNRASESHEAARSAVELAYEATPLPTANVAPTQEPAPVVQEAVSEQLPPFTPSPFNSPEPALPPVPAPVDFSQLPPPPPLPSFGPPQGPLPPEQLGQIFASPSPDVVPPAAEPAPNDPNQFKIPGQ